MQETNLAQYNDNAARTPLSRPADVAPGNSPGTLTASDTTWDGGGNYVWEINNATGTAGAASGSG